MAIEVVEFDPSHCEGARAHPTQEHYQPFLDDPGMFRLLWPETNSALDGDDLVALGGTTFIDGASGGWMLFTDKITPAYFVLIHRYAVHFLRHFEQINHPLFMHVDPDNPNAKRWAGLLGLETKRTDILPDGRRMLRVETHVS